MASARENEYRPDIVFPPGDTIAGMLDDRGWSKNDFADRLQKTNKFVSDLLAGRAPISPETAFDLERIFGVDAAFWVNLEQNYRIHLLRQKNTAELETLGAWVAQFPIRQMVKLRWIEKFKAVASQAEELLKFFGVSSLEAWNDLWEKDRIAVALRSSRKFTTNPPSLAAWLRRGEQAAEHITCAPYNERQFRKNVHELRALTRDANLSECVKRMRRLCAEAGVLVVFVPEIPGTRASGAAWWHNPEKAVIQLSLRHKTHDHLWFSFFHEAKHILDHPKKMVFVSGDEIDGDSGRMELEREADSFAADLLIPPKAFKSFLAKGRPTLDAISAFATDVDTAPGIVVGRLQHEGVIPFKQGNGLKVRLDWEKLAMPPEVP
ncbi:MAG: ImmA/IrrE family metallo-endopeptidase [Deltaproteobacteria bacterium]|nr:ImmA/IrrE family metallo-endopeptidase [Pseudomonadota bacterium]NCD26325.1 ImmA/IrrE family metallo-endopeptidase [Deltaproteobacteria bacterium]